MPRDGALCKRVQEYTKSQIQIDCRAQKIVFLKCLNINFIFLCFLPWPLPYYKQKYQQICTEMNEIHSNRKNSLIITENVKSNLKFLYSILDANENSLMSISSSEDQKQLDKASPTDVRRYFPQIRTLLKNTNQPFKCVGLYSRLLQIKCFDSIYSDPIFSETFFNAKIHPLLTAYLQNQTPYYRMKFQTEKILDVFYKYIFCEHGELMEKNLKDGMVSNLGKWLFEEGLQKMFKKYYNTPQQFTLFMSEFMLHGLAAMFLAAVSILSKRTYKSQMHEIDLIEIAYLKKYGLK